MAWKSKARMNIKRTVFEKRMSALKKREYVSK